MDSGRLFFNSSSGGGNMLFLGSGDPFFRGSVMNLEDPSKRKSIFGSPEELFDDEYYDEQLPEKKRRLTPEQVHLLEKSFEAENKLEPERKTQLAKKLGLQPRQVAVWFQNRRARWKTKQLEKDYDQLKSSYDSLLSTYDSVARENEKLKSEILCLSKKLEQQTKDDVGGEPVLPGDDHDHDHHHQLPVSTAGSPPDLLINVKVVEDRVSTGSGESGVVDEVELEGSHDHQLVDSTGDSYLISDDGDYHNNPAAGCGRSEEDDIGSDDGQNNYFPAGGFEDHNNNNHGGEGESMGWWVWS